MTTRAAPLRAHIAAALGIGAGILALFVVTIVAASIGLHVLVALSLGDPWALLVVGVTAAAVIGWVAGKVEGA